MAATHVNHRVENSGALFSGKKFWIAQKVPARSRWLDLVKENGGEIVQWDKYADILIADHARKNAAPGTISWKFIEDSVKKGELEDIEKYRAGPPVGSIRPVGAAEPPRKGRITFTLADDRILANWVAKKVAQGHSARGNSIYQALEKIHPHHTFQSWRDRWIKYIQYRPHSEYIDAATPSHTRGPSEAPISSRLPVAKSPESLERDVRPSEAPTKGVSGSAPQYSFTALSPPMICESLNTKASEYKPGHEPSVTPAEDVGCPRLLLLPNDPFRSPDVVQPAAPVQKGIQNITGSTWRGESPGRPPFTFEEYKSLTEIYDDIMNIDEEKVDIAWQTWAQSYPRHTAQEWQEFWEKKVKPREPFSRENLSDSKSSVSVKDETAPEITPAEKHQALFTQKLAKFSAEHHIEIDFYPEISGHRISLFKLFQFIRQPEVGGFDRIEAVGRWQEVASFLGLNTFRDPSIASELKRVCEDMLADFSDFVSEYWRMLDDYANRGEQLSEEEKIHHELFAPRSLNLIERSPKLDHEDTLRSITESRVPESVKLDERDNSQHKFMGANSKRSLQIMDPSPSKRQKIDKGKGKMWEIPATPENILSSHEQTYRSSPPRFNISKSTAEDRKLIGVCEMEDSPLSFSSFSSFSKPHISSNEILRRISKEMHEEPQTQDFNFPIATNSDSGSILDDDLLSLGDSMAAIAGSIHKNSSTQSQSDSQRLISELEEIIDHYVALGYAESIVRKALAATTMETGDLGIVVESMTSGHGVPFNIQGVWTEDDDLAVMLAEDTNEYAKVLAKHGGTRCDVRKQFLIDVQVIRSS